MGVFVAVRPVDGPVVAPSPGPFHFVSSGLAWGTLTQCKMIDRGRGQWWEVHKRCIEQRHARVCEGDGNRQQPQQPLGFSLPFRSMGALVFVSSWLFLQRRALIAVVEGPAVCWWSDSCANGAAVVSKCVVTQQPLGSPEALFFSFFHPGRRDGTGKSKGFAFRSWS